MGNDLIQAQYEQLDTVAGQFGNQAKAQSELQNQLKRAMQPLQQGGWQGKGSAAFFAVMNSQILPAMHRLSDALEQARSVTLEVKMTLQNADKEASKPFHGNGVQHISNGTTENYPTSQLSMGIPPGSLPPRPPPPPPPAKGDGSAAHGSEDRNWFERRYDETVAALFARIADGADAMGMDNAARHMRHYLDNSGTELDISPEAMLRDLPGLREKANQSFEYELLPAINERVDKEYTGQPMRFQVTTDWQGYYAGKKESEDWFFAVGGFSFAHGADVLVTSNPDGTAHVEIQHQLHVFDRYNWDKGKGVEIMGVRVGDQQLGGLHEAGIAEEYEVWGKSNPHQYSYDYTPGSGGVSTGAVEPWGEGTLAEPTPDRSTREGREQARSPRRDDPTRNNDRER